MEHPLLRPPARDLASLPAADRLMEHQRKRNAKLSTLRAEALLEKERKFREQCTFRPEILPRRPSSVGRAPSVSSSRGSSPARRRPIQSPKLHDDDEDGNHRTHRVPPSKARSSTNSGLRPRRVLYDDSSMNGAVVSSRLSLTTSSVSHPPHHHQHQLYSPHSGNSSNGGGSSGGGGNVFERLATDRSEFYSRMTERRIATVTEEERTTCTFQPNVNHNLDERLEEWKGGYTATERLYGLALKKQEDRATAVLQKIEQDAEERRMQERNQLHRVFFRAVEDLNGVVESPKFTASPSASSPRSYLATTTEKSTIVGGVGTSTVASRYREDPRMREVRVVELRRRVQLDESDGPSPRYLAPTPTARATSASSSVDRMVRRRGSSSSAPPPSAPGLDQHLERMRRAAQLAEEKSAARERYVDPTVVQPLHHLLRASTPRSTSANRVRGATPERTQRGRGQEGLSVSDAAPRDMALHNGVPVSKPVVFAGLEAHQREQDERARARLRAEQLALQKQFNPRTNAALYYRTKKLFAENGAK